MATKYENLFAALAAPFEGWEVKKRVQGGRDLHYVTARTVENRLDNILGPENWWDEYVPSENSVLCRLTIQLPDGKTLTKSDAGGYAGMADSGDDDKSGYSDALKRAAARFGVGRYLYKDGVPIYAQSLHQGAYYDPVREVQAARTANGQGQQQQTTSSNSGGSAPKSGKAMFAWCREQEDQRHVGIVKYLNTWAQQNNYPARMVDWDADTIAAAYAVAIKKIEGAHAHQGGTAESDRPFRGR